MSSKSLTTFDPAKKANDSLSAHGKFNRNPNLDLLRAVAVLMVVIHHLFRIWPVPRPRITAVTQFGEYGVDLFFVLSGWLIGGLFWRENEKFGNIRIPRFVLRRAFRTVPPYLAALGVSYFAVLIARHESFDWRYLVFLQNYQDNIPYFQVSWSLCIEEHFYLIMPLFVLVVTRLSTRSHYLLLAIAALPILFRAMSAGTEEQTQFGYIYTATHLRYEGLILGVWASFVYQCRPSTWNILQRLSPTCLVLASIMLIVVARLPKAWEYIFLYSAVDLFFFFLLIVLVNRRSTSFSASRIVFWTASISYSIYLTNQLAIHAALRLIKQTASFSETLHFLIAAICILGAGFFFYWFVEAPSLAMRQWLTPNRKY